MNVEVKALITVTVLIFKFKEKTQTDDESSHRNFVFFGCLNLQINGWKCHSRSFEPGIFRSI